MKIRIMIAMILMALFATATVFPGGSREPASSPATETAALVLYHWDTTGIVEAQVREFEAQNPNISVELVLTPRNDYPDRLRVSLSGGENVDVYATANTAEYQLFTSTFGAVDLEPLTRQGGLSLENYGAMLNILRVDDQLFGLPAQRDAWMLFFNKDHFDRLGVQYPRNGMSWSEYEELASAVTTSDTYGSFMQDWAQIWYAPQVQLGRTIFDDDLSAAMDGLAMHGRMQNEARSEMTWAEVRSGSIHHRDAFAQQRVAMMFIGPWMISILNAFQEDGTIDFDYDVVVPPQPPRAVENSTLGGPGHMLTINPRTKYSEAAWRLVSFLAGPEGSLMRAEDGQPPAYADDLIVAAFVGEDPQPESLEVFLELNPLVERPPRPGVSDVYSIFSEEGELYLIGEQTLEETEENIRRRRQEVIDETATN